MAYDHKPRFYVRFNAEDNAYYFSGNGNSDNCEITGDGVFALSSKNAEVKVNYEKLGDNAVSQTTELKNTGTEPLCVELLGSAFVCGIGRGGVTPWKKGRFILHYTENCWTGEAQWRHVTAEQAGLYRTYNHGTQSSFRLSSQSSWSTCRHEPLLIVEDTELNKSWFAEIDCGHGWCINCGVRGYRDDIELVILTSDCLENNDGFYKTLMPGETLTSCRSVTGCVGGGFEEAAAALTEARRSLRKTGFDVPPLCYNDYMNALWALPTKEKTLPLAKAAAEAGCEYYIMDAGWYGVNGDENKDLGMWAVNDKPFGDEGLQGIFDFIYSLGMKPGIWFEFESVGSGAEIVKEHPEYLLYRRGHRIGGDRCLFDFRQNGVREHIRSRVRALYEMGVRYIKNDYNANTGVGIDPGGAASVHDHAAAFYGFTEELRREFPDLILESCASGAMRSDMETLSHFDLQSVSDQEDHFRLPSIVSGTEACIPPEACGVWAYPYPVKIDFRASFTPSAEFTNRFTDGKTTVYCLVTGLLGLMYLSGRIDCADGFNRSLIKEAAELYKKYRGYISRSVPVYPTGTFDIDTDKTDTFGLYGKKDGVLTLGVWNNSEQPSEICLELCKYFANGKIEDVYPRIGGYEAAIDKSKLTVKLPGGKSAAFIAIRFSAT